MARIRDAKGKGSTNSYSRLFNNDEVGTLITKIHSTSISQGTELEKIIKEMTIPNLFIDDFLGKCNRRDSCVSNGVYAYYYKDCIRSKFLEELEKSISATKTKHNYPDFLIFEINDECQQCWLCELKVGHTFDTKKSRSEFESLNLTACELGRILQMRIDFFICCFFAESREEIEKGLKSEFLLENIRTGAELCELLNISLSEVKNKLNADCEDNYKYFVTELASVSGFEIEHTKILSDHISEEINIDEQDRCR